MLVGKHHLWKPRLWKIIVSLDCLKIYHSSDKQWPQIGKKNSQKQWKISPHQVTKQNWCFNHDSFSDSGLESYLDLNNKELLKLNLNIYLFRVSTLTKKRKLNNIWNKDLHFSFSFYPICCVSAWIVFLVGITRSVHTEIPWC